jgi:peroxiredoxin
MYPHERSLVERLKDKPFALIGVNSDPRDKVKDAMQREKISWRSFWDGGNTNGPIATRWNVRAWPTIYVLDQEGVIRYKNVRGEAMDKAVDELLAKLSSAPSKSTNN